MTGHAMFDRKPTIPDREKARMTSLRPIVPTLTLMALLTACGGTPTDEGGTTRVILANPSFATNIQEIFVRRGCTASNCHGSALSGGLGLATASYTNLVNVPAVAVNNPGIGLNRVEPGDIAASYLWLKVSGTSAGTRMPQGGPVLDATDLGNIMNWINTGAPDN